MKSYVINLDFCEDRFEAFQEKWPENSVIERPERFRAIHGDTCTPPPSWRAGNGAWGCMMSHVGVLQQAMMDKLPSFAVFEDDAWFCEDFSEKLEDFMAAVPEDYQQVYLGGDLMHARTHPPIVVNDKVLRPFNVNRTHAMIFGVLGMKEIYNYVCSLPYMSQDHIDHHLGRWHEDARNKVYCPNEWLVGQFGFQSNVSGRLEEPTLFAPPISYAQSHKLYTDPVCVVFRASLSLIPECRKRLHFGNQINNSGIDVSLAEAMRLRNPAPAIWGFYNWVRAEIASEKSNRLPAAYAPELSLEDIRAGLPGVKIIVVEHCANSAEVEAQIEKQIHG